MEVAGQDQSGGGMTERSFVHAAFAVGEVEAVVQNYSRSQ